MTTAEKRSRGRPRSFDKTDALAAITQVFYQKGFDATSLDDLSDVTGLTRPSLYAAFGNKEATYLAVLAAVTADMERGLKAASAKAATLEDALRQFYQSALDRYVDGPYGPCGCIVMTTAVTRATQSEAIRGYVAEVLAHLDASVMRLYDHLWTGDPALKAQKAPMAVAVMQSLSIRARAGESRASLEALVETLLPSLIQ